MCENLLSVVLTEKKQRLEDEVNDTRNQMNKNIATSVSSKHKTVKPQSFDKEVEKNNEEVHLH